MTRSFKDRRERQLGTPQPIHKALKITQAGLWDHVWLLEEIAPSQTREKLMQFLVLKGRTLNQRKLLCTF